MEGTRGRRTQHCSRGPWTMSQVEEETSRELVTLLAVLLGLLLAAVMFLVLKETRSSISEYNKSCIICKIETV